MILRVKCLYFEIVINRRYFVSHTIPYNMLKFLTIPLVTPSHTTRDAFVNLSFASWDAFEILKENIFVRTVATGAV